MPRLSMRFFSCFSLPTKQTTGQKAEGSCAVGSKERTMVQINGVTMRYLTTAKAPCSLSSSDAIADAGPLKPTSSNAQYPSYEEYEQAGLVF